MAASLSGTSHAMKPHREILRDLYRAHGITLDAIAKRMGWRSPRTVAHKLHGARDWASGELERMCEIAGITLVQLAELSSDLQVTKTQEAVTVARLVDALPLADRERVLQYALGLQTPPAPEK